MIFENNVIFTGVSKRISKKTDNEYLIANFLDDEGVQFGALVKCNIPEIEQLDVVNATFDLSVGRYMSLSVIRLEVISLEVF